MGTTTDGTSINGMKTGLRFMNLDFEIRRKVTKPFSLAVVFDFTRNHWMVASCFGGVSLVMDPWTGRTQAQPWRRFQNALLNFTSKSYALIVA